MNIRLAAKKIAKNFGIDLRVYNPSQSEAARLGRLLEHYKVDLVLDVGANSGQFAEYLRYVGYAGKIVCFEPLAAPYAKLCELAKRDSGIVCAQRMALGDYDGEIDLNRAVCHESSSVLKVTEQHAEREPLARFVGCEKVPVRRLDNVVMDYMRDFTKPFLKIDVQGYEPQVLCGGLKTLAQLVGLQLELSLTHLYEGERTFSETLAFVESHGFLLHDINPCYADKNTGRTYQVDAVFFRE